MKTNKIEKILITEMLQGLYTVSVPSDEILGIYVYGSRLYGNDTENSDLDYVIVLNQKTTSPKMWGNSYIQIETEDLDLHIMTDGEYKKRLENHDIMALECYFQEDPILKYEVNFELNLPMLRKSISSVTSNSWVKAKKKITLDEEDSKIGLKSYYHVFRILDFGIQIAKYGKIEDFSFSGALSPVRDKDIENIRNPEWEYWDKKLKPLYNAKKTEFKKYAPKLIKKEG